ncbi:Aldehyde dehydrogenase family 3 member F1 [Hordeum vulgare]|nr:Aldehyde dehydrogenase family 3 member F1 [Hordeum vulgare]
MGTMATSVEEIGAAVELPALQRRLGELRATFEGGRTRPLSWRQSQMRALLRLLADKEEDAFRALHADLGKHRTEAYRDEVLPSPFASSAPSHVAVLRRAHAGTPTLVPLISIIKCPQPHTLLEYVCCDQIPLSSKRKFQETYQLLDVRFALKELCHRSKQNEVTGILIFR